MHNGTTERVVINHHDKIAQFTVQRIYSSQLVEVENFDDKGSRGSGGFGSSGTK
jgi:dUTPase